MKKIIAFFSICVLFSTQLQAQLVQNFNFSQNEIAFVQQNGYEIIQHPQLHNISSNELAGKPQVPVKYFNILLPKGAKVTDVSLQIVSEEQITGNHLLYPIQPPHYANGKEQTAFVEPDQSIYNSNTPYPNSANNIVSFKTNVFRDYSFANIGFIPFRYIPKDKILHLFTNVNISISYTVNSNAKSPRLRDYSDMDKSIYNFVEQSMLNGSHIQSSDYYDEAHTKIIQYQTKNNNSIISKAFKPTPLPSTEGSAVKYVIITNNHKTNGVNVGDFVSEFQNFANWKTQSGMPAKVVSVDEIVNTYSGVDIQEKIREFIKEAYSKWGTEYVLLGGMSSIIPVRYLRSFMNCELYTDLYYSAIDDGTENMEDNWNANGNNIYAETDDNCDFTPDIAIGRAPIDTLDELQLFLKKNFTYARCSYASDYDASIPDGAWLNKQLNICGPIEDDYIWYDELNEEQVAFGENGMVPSWFTTAFYSENSGVSSNMCNEQYTMHYDYDAIHTNYWWENMNDPDDNSHTWCPAYYPLDEHGCDTDAPGVPIIDAYITHDDVITQINNRYGIIYHMDHSGPWGMGLTKTSQGLRGIDFQNLSNSQNKYPVLIAGGCYTTAIAMDYYIGEQWINDINGGVCFFGNSVDIVTNTGVAHGVSFFKTLYESKKYQIGYTNILTGINAEYEEIEMFQLGHILGDPSLSIYTDAPSTMSCSAPSLTNGHTSNYMISGISGIPTGEQATLTLYKEDEVLASASIADNESSHSFDITPDTLGEMKVTMTCHNTTPYEQTININQKNGVHLYVSNVEIINDTNGIIEPGEQVDIQLTIKNTGDTISNSGLATLSSTNTDVNTTISSAVTYSAINPNNPNGVNVIFSFTADTENDIIPFSLNIGGTFTEDFFLNVISPQLELGDRIATRNGNEVNDFSQNFDYELFIRVNNFGEVGTNVTSVLTTTSSHIQINTGSYNYGFIDAVTDKVNSTSFKFHTKSSYTPNSPIPLKLTLTDSNGIVKQISFDLKNEIPSTVSSFDFSSSTNHILLKWVLPIGMEPLDINGYNIYRDIDISGNFEEKINNGHL